MYTDWDAHCSPINIWNLILRLNNLVKVQYLGVLQWIRIGKENAEKIPNLLSTYVSYSLSSEAQIRDFRGKMAVLALASLFHL